MKSRKHEIDKEFRRQLQAIANGRLEAISVQELQQISDRQDFSSILEGPDELSDQDRMECRQLAEAAYQQR